MSGMLVNTPLPSNFASLILNRHSLRLLAYLSPSEHTAKSRKPHPNSPTVELARESASVLVKNKFDLNEAVKTPCNDLVALAHYALGSSAAKMNGAQPPRPLPNGAAVNGTSTAVKPKLVKKKKAAQSLFMSTNNRRQAKFQDQAIRTDAGFYHSQKKDDKAQKTKAEDENPQNLIEEEEVQQALKIPHLADEFKNLRPEERYSGFSDPRLQQQPGHSYRDYKLVTTRGELLKLLRYHLLQIIGDEPTDIRNESNFVQPAKLHRRDPLADELASMKAGPAEVKSELDAEQREELNNRKEQRAREREANLAQVAPSANSAKKTHNFKVKTQQVYQRKGVPEEEARIRQTNYEEKIPWVLEDYDSQHCFVGEYQPGAYGQHVAFAYEPTPDRSGQFRLIPVEKVYEFKPKPKVYNTMTDAEIEAAYKRGAVDPAWLRELQYKRQQQKSLEKEYQNKVVGLYTGSRKPQSAGIQRKGEDGDLDFEDDMFADDEEGYLFGDDEKDEDEKLAEKKIKEEQLQANFLDFRDQHEDEIEAEREERLAEERKFYSKRVRKGLRKHEGNYNQASDSESDSSTDSEEERERLEQEKLKNAKKEEDGLDGKKSAMSSGANTPSGRKEKRGSDREASAKKSKSLKRPGSPNLSDASGTDASTARKKKRKSHHISSTQPTAGPSRPISPDNLDPTSAASRQSRASFASHTAGSDTETAGVMSDGTAKRIKLKVSNQPAIKREPGLSPPTSRAGSPVPRPASTGPPSTLPSKEDIAAAIPVDGITHKELFVRVPAIKHAMQDPKTKAELLTLIKSVSQTAGGKLYPIGSLPAGTVGASPPLAASANGSGTSG